VTGAPDIIMCELTGVSGGDSGLPVLIVRSGESGRLMLRAINEGGFACADVDLIQMLEWFNRIAPQPINVEFINSSLPSGKHT
jgi:hypothetical protein